jgi:hypothetical protein
MVASSVFAAMNGRVRDEKSIKTESRNKIVDSRVIIIE